MTINKFLTRVLSKSLLLSSILILGCKNDFVQPASPKGSTINSIASTSDNLALFAAALNKTGLSSSLNNNNSGYFTVFAPSDDAFITYFQTLKANPTLTKQNVLDTLNNLKPTSISTPTINQLATILNYHILSSKITSDNLTGNQVFTMSNSARLSVSKVGADILLNANMPGVTTLNGAKIVTADLEASNGVIHIIDKILIAPTTASILSVLGITVSYATNPATVNVTSTDANDNNYNLFALALKKAGLATALSPNISPLPDFTIFAPTDKAFRDYLGVANETNGAAAINAMNADATALLTDMLKFHILTGRVVSTDLYNGQQVTTWLTGKVLNVNITGSTITLVDSNTGKTDPVITSANVLTNAGVLHQINNVLYPN